jgi:hypothetical protein
VHELVSPVSESQRNYPPLSRAPRFAHRFGMSP